MSDWRGPLNEAGRTAGRNSVKDCADENFIESKEQEELAQLQPAAAGLGGSAAQPANAFEVRALSLNPQPTSPSCGEFPSVG